MTAVTHYKPHGWLLPDLTHEPSRNAGWMRWRMLVSALASQRSWSYLLAERVRTTDCLPYCAWGWGVVTTPVLWKGEAPPPTQTAETLDALIAKVRILHGQAR